MSKGIVSHVNTSLDHLEISFLPPDRIGCMIEVDPRYTHHEALKYETKCFYCQLTFSSISYSKFFVEFTSIRRSTPPSEKIEFTSLALAIDELIKTTKDGHIAWISNGLDLVATVDCT